MSLAAQDKAFAALADPTRRAIVERLARSPTRVTDVGVPDTELGRGHQEGWTAIVGEMAKALE